jgi:hypothetical protein
MNDALRPISIRTVKEHLRTVQVVYLPFYVALANERRWAALDRPPCPNRAIL